MSTTTGVRSRDSSDRRVSPVFLVIVAVMAVSGWAVWSQFTGSGALSARVAVFLFVTSAWVVSLCLHEYAHARTALHGGDVSIPEKGYLTLNPARYTHAVLSILLPLLFLVMGGIGLPGGAVFIERGRIRSRAAHSLVSAAGPLTNALFAVVCTAPFWIGGGDGIPAHFRYALGFLALLQVTAAILNILPVPGLDGYGVVEPWLSPNTRRQIAPFAPFGMIAVFAVLWQSSVNGAFFDMIDTILHWFGVTHNDSVCGRLLFQFWSRQNAYCSAGQA
jgi:Zn-dependent protease